MIRYDNQGVKMKKLFITPLCLAIIGCIWTGVAYAQQAQLQWSQTS